MAYAELAELATKSPNQRIALFRDVGKNMDNTAWMQFSRECMNILAKMRADIAKEHTGDKKRKSFSTKTQVFGTLTHLSYSCSYPCPKGREACSSQSYTVIGCWCARQTKDQHQCIGWSYRQIVCWSIDICYLLRQCYRFRKGTQTLGIWFMQLDSPKRQKLEEDAGIVCCYSRTKDSSGL